MKRKISKTITKSILSLALVTSPLISGTALAESSLYRSRMHQELVTTGKTIYENRCSGCHGLDGKGKGPGSAQLDIKPRDFTRGIYKFKSGMAGVMPSNDDLLKTLNQGIPGSSMPSFRLLTEVEKQAVIEYIKTFAPEKWQNTAVASSTLPSRPEGVFTRKADFIESARKGRVWYQELGCVSCHGTTGQGNGPSSATLVDAWDHPILPANLTKKQIKRGWTIEDVASSVAYGVDGTPMPSYLDSMPEPAIVWDISAYIFYLRGQSAGLYPEEPIPALPTEGTLPQAEVDAVMSKYNL